MIRIASQPKPAVPAWHAGFLAMLPAIETHARIAFRDLDPEAREEAIQEVVANACRAYVRLVELGKLDIAYPSVLARYGVAQVRDGRKVGGKLNIHDVLSPYCQQRKGVLVERLDKYDHEEDCWQEILVEDRTAGPADLAASRIDFSAWLKFLPGRMRRIANCLATGETTTTTAGKFKVSPGRISQIRKELCRAWHRFQGEEPGMAVA